MSTVHRILVVGAGAMGSQIALVCALAGYHATLADIDPERVRAADDEIDELLLRREEKGKLGSVQAAAARARLDTGTDIESAAAAADYVIEAVVEKLEVKRELFARLDRVVPAHTVFASNSSGFVPSRLATATDRADRFCNLHFFNPALVMTCVEVVPGPQTSPATLATTVELAERLGKAPVVLDREIPGFIANRILNAVRDEAIALLEADIAPVESIDTACRTALGYPMGPFELMDLTGIDIGYYTKQARYAETRDPRDAPSRSVATLVARGELGRKTGAGWYTYAADGNATARPRPQEL